MDTLILNKKKFVVLEQRKFDRIQLKAAKKTLPVKKLSLVEGRKHALKLVDKWANEK